MQSVKNLEELAILMRRPKKGIEARSAVLESERYDIVRGKDFVRWVRANLETVELFTTKGLLKTRVPPSLLKHDNGSVLKLQQALTRHLLSLHR